MTTKPLQDIIEGKCEEFERDFIFRGRDEFAHITEKLAEHHTIDEVKSFLRTALKEAIIEGIESVLPPEMPHQEPVCGSECQICHEQSGFEECRTLILRSLQAIKENM